MLWPPYFSDSTFVIAAVSVVLPWSMCPIVPTLTCGLLRSNFSFATPNYPFLKVLCGPEGPNLRNILPLDEPLASRWPAARALRGGPDGLARPVLDDLLRDARGDLVVPIELHRVGRA